MPSCLKKSKLVFKRLDVVPFPKFEDLGKYSRKVTLVHLSPNWLFEKKIPSLLYMFIIPFSLKIRLGRESLLVRLHFLKKKIFYLSVFKNILSETSV